jgi:hypothetical protein
MKGLLVNNKREDRFIYFGSMLHVLNEIRAGALLLSDTYYNTSNEKWEELNNISYLKKQNIPITRDVLDNTPPPEEPEPFHFMRYFDKFSFTNALSANKHIL